jgi:hypothetical protein
MKSSRFGGCSKVPVRDLIIIEKDMREKARKSEKVTTYKTCQANANMSYGYLVQTSSALDNSS